MADASRFKIETGPMSADVFGISVWIVQASDTYTTQLGLPAFSTLRIVSSVLLCP